MGLILTWMERLSLDAVLVALAWGWAAGHTAIGYGWMGLLASGIWLTYVADRLFDVRERGMVPDTDRHRFYFRNRMLFAIGWLIVFLASVPAAWVLLPAWKLTGGWMVVLIVCLYLVLVDRFSRKGKSRGLKRVSVPVIFALGVAWMAEGWRSPQGWLNITCLFFAALADVLLLDALEHEGEAVTLFLHVLRVLAVSGLGGVLAISAALGYPASYGAALVVLGGFYLIYRKLSSKAAAIHRRGYADLVLFLAGCVSAVLGMVFPWA